jgi:hypothetical protein
MNRRRTDAPPDDCQSGAAAAWLVLAIWLCAFVLGIAINVVVS